MPGTLLDEWNPLPTSGQKGRAVDRDLVEAARHGDREAFAILARTRGDRLFAITQRILRDNNRA